MMKFDLFGRLHLIFETGRHVGYERYFNNEYLRISSKAISHGGAPRITVKIVQQLPSEELGDIRRSVRCKSLFIFHYLIRDIDSDAVTIFFKRHFMDNIYMNAVAVFLQAQILEPVMYLKFLQTNLLFMHAGGVCDERSGYLFPAHGGTGKTTFTIALLNCGYKLLGDDLLIVDVEKRKVYPYPRPLHLFTYNIKNLHGASVPWKYKRAVYCKNVLRFFLERALRTEFLISTRVHADELFDNSPFGEAVAYQGIYILLKEGPAISTKKVTSTNSLQLAREIMGTADLNDSLYLLLSNSDRIKSAKRLEEDVIQRLLRQMGRVTYVNTRMLDLSDLNRFIDRCFNQRAVSQ